MVSRLMLNLRNEELKRGPVISSNHRMSSRANAEQQHLASSQFTKALPITGSRRELETGWSAFESSLVGNLGAPIITFEQWRAAVEQAAGKSLDELVAKTMEQIDINPLYTRADLERLEHLGYLAGIPPYLRGPYAAMYVLRPWASASSPRPTAMAMTASWSGRSAAWAPV